MSVAAYASLVAKRPVERLAQRDADILYRVMGIDMQVAICANIQIDQAMSGDLIEHVFEERYACVKRALSVAVKVDGDFDAGLQCRALYRGFTLSRCLRAHHNPCPGGNATP